MPSTRNAGVVNRVSAIWGPYRDDGTGRRDAHRGQLVLDFGAEVLRVGNAESLSRNSGVPSRRLRVVCGTTAFTSFLQESLAPGLCGWSHARCARLLRG